MERRELSRIVLQRRLGSAPARHTFEQCSDIGVLHKMEKGMGEKLEYSPDSEGRETHQPI